VWGGEGGVVANSLSFFVTKRREKERDSNARAHVCLFVFLRLPLFVTTFNYLPFRFLHFS
jgi:hypothetical protein